MCKTMKSLFVMFVFEFIVFFANGNFVSCCSAASAVVSNRIEGMPAIALQDERHKESESNLKNRTARNDEKYSASVPACKSVKITAVGDCTIGWDDRFLRGNRFDVYLERADGDYGYYLAKVRDIFREGDFTIANLEGTFTSHTEKVEKTFNFSAPEAYKNVLMWGCVDAVSLGNNHTYDFGYIGYQDTVRALDSIGISYFGHDRYLVKEVRGVKIGLFSLLDYDCKHYHEIDKALACLKEQKCDLIIAAMHWGIEHTYVQTWEQIAMGRYLIDNGADMVLGSHPHVLQGIEKYKGKYILYSMGNFCFGGNTDPDDKDTVIFQQTFTFVNGELLTDDNIKIIPASVSGVDWCNNYQPVALEGADKERVMRKIMRYSSGFSYRE